MMQIVRVQHKFVAGVQPSLSSVGRDVSGPVGGGAKRLLDIVLVTLGLLLLSPVILGLIILLKAKDRGPLLYGHRRVGYGGREFRCWKFRTMVVDGDAVLERHLRANPDEAIIWNEQRKLNNDPRVTRIGAVLRKLSLDELPQLINVLKGDMSLIGPRPVVQAELDNYGSSARHYLATRPGLSGLWQVSGRSDTTYAERVQLDRFYVMNWSFWRDLRLIVMTIPAVAMSRGAH